MKLLLSVVFGMLLMFGEFAHSQTDVSHGYYPKGGPDLGVEDVSLIQLIANPQVYDNKRVRITGFVHLEFEGNAIYLHGEDFQYGITKNALWVDLPKDMTHEQVEAVNDRYAICTGTFAAGMHGHLGMNSGEMVQITRLESWIIHPRPVGK